MPSYHYISFSPQESERFGLQVYRANLESILFPEIEDFLRSEQADLLICRIPAYNLYEISMFDHSRYDCIVADTLVYYQADLLLFGQKSYKNSLDFCLMEQVSAPLNISSIIEETFKGYISHYRANAAFSPQDILDGYVQWALSFLVNNENKKFWLVENEGQVLGFFTMTFTEKMAEGTLAGVLQSASGRGIYRDIIRFMQNFARENGATKLEISTQVHNHSVQRVLSTEDMKIVKSVNTIHISNR